MRVLDYLLLAGIGGLTGWALGHLHKHRKKGGCHGDCANCGGCH